MELLIAASTGGNECVDKSEGIADKFANILHAVGHHGRHFPGGVEIVKAIEAGALVGEGGAHPRLHVAHLKLERDSSQMLQLRQRIVNLVRGVSEILQTFIERRFFSFTNFSGASGRFDAGGPDGNVASIKEADYHGRIYEIP